MSTCVGLMSSALKARTAQIATTKKAYLSVDMNFIYEMKIRMKWENLLAVNRPVITTIIDIGSDGSVVMQIEYRVVLSWWWVFKKIHLQMWVGEFTKIMIDFCWNKAFISTFGTFFWKYSPFKLVPPDFWQYPALCSLQSISAYA